MATSTHNMAVSKFPQFGDGDVEIQLTTSGDKCILHSFVLALHSSWFKASLSERWRGSGGTGAAAAGDAGYVVTGSEHTVSEGTNKPRWVYKLYFDKGSADGFLLREGCTTSAEMYNDIVPSEVVLDVDDDELDIDRASIVKAHKDLFGALYHIPLSFDDDDLYGDLKSIMDVAKLATTYNCEAIIKHYMENLLLQLYNDDVLEMCFHTPVCAFRLAMAVKSDWIFMEAATNLIGRSRRVFTATLPALDEMGIAELLEAKRLDFIGTLRQAELGLFCLQPYNASSSAQTSICYFRHWLSKSLKESKEGSALGPGYAHVYHCIATKNFFDKHEDAIRKFVMAMNGDAAYPVRKNLEDDMNQVARRAAAIVEPLREDVTKLQSQKKDNHRSLRYMALDYDDLPWIKK